MQRLDQRQRQDPLHGRGALAVGVLPERAVVGLLFRVPNDQRRQPTLQQLSIDDHPADPAVAIAEGMDHFEIQVKSRDRVQEVGVEVTGVLQQYLVDHAFDLLRRRRDVGAYPHILPALAKTAGDVVVNRSDQHLVQQQDPFLAQLRGVGSVALVLDDARQVDCLEHFSHRHVAGQHLLQQDLLGVLQGERGVLDGIRVVDALGDLHLVDHRQE